MICIMIRKDASVHLSAEDMKFMTRWALCQIEFCTRYNSVNYYECLQHA